MKDSTHTLPAGSPVDSPLSHASSGGTVLDSAYSWYALFIMAVACALSYIDRQLLNLLVDPVRHSLQITDTQVSLVQGAAFVSAYLIAVPIYGRLADTTNRRNVLVAGICAWSVFTALCGRAESYGELFAFRFFVGASEACIIPVCYSLIADYFSAQRMPRAVSLFHVAPLVGSGVSLVVGGLVFALANNVRTLLPILNTLAVWQMAFVLIGLPGLLVAAVVFLTVREPTRSQATHPKAADRPYTVRETATFIWTRRGFYVRFYLSIGMFAIVILGLPAWLPTFLIRVHGAARATIGFQFGVVVIICATVGILIGPWISSAIFEKRGRSDALLRTAAWSMIAAAICCAAVPFTPDVTSTLAVTAAAVFFFSLPTGIMPTTIQLATPSRMRGTVGAFYTFSSQSIGFGLGPTSIALMTDKVFQDPKMVGSSIAIVCPIASVIACWLLFSSLKHYRRLLEERKANGALNAA
ncbi:MFS family permease [Paraburkholderia sp. HC6.4b]|uniref:MFS transporter n=1 Tax=unclassified Paraburkholderia TaxID=2615204 RepID=UPI0016224295|nr:MULTISPECIES: MFS transporter [unclassified Paraburkholderia]MBB5406333.1 MFS family permease [Paraburkholderia sp. HC6.4b]MBB5448731.1 MFS family permease [Paraburkholderia sp. Kb1A]